ncbi:MAG: hypothetical protein II007_15355 [Gammaproteobacteria bacterium]|nr:hypothetical protein [Gammaproteobacteria bacterium]
MGDRLSPSREIYLVVDGDYYPWGTADSTLRLTLLGRQFAPTRLGLLLFICLLPVSLLFYRYLLWGIFFEVGLPSSQRVRLLCGYDAWCRALQRVEPGFKVCSAEADG